MGCEIDVAYGASFVARKSNLVHHIYCLDIFAPVAFARVAGGREIAGVIADPPYASGGNTVSAKRRDVNEKYSTEKTYPSFHNDHVGKRRDSETIGGGYARTGEIYPRNSGRMRRDRLAARRPGPSPAPGSRSCALSGAELLAVLLGRPARTTSNH